MRAFKLRPAYKDYIWGGTKLKSEFLKDTPYERTAESWELSVHKDGESTILGGECDGKKLSEILTPSMLGTRCKGTLPILIKLIDSADNLSVQVHPSDEYAVKNENDNGKTEMWYVIDAEKGAGIYCGFKKTVTKSELIKRADEGSLLEILNFIPCAAGDSFFIPSGTVHAIGKGLTIYEIQQSSNVTYRLYDYNRVGADGQKRALHIKKAAEVSDTSKHKNCKNIIERNSADFCIKLLCECEYFSAREVECLTHGQFQVGFDSFAAASVVGGVGEIAGLCVERGDTVFIPAGFGAVEFNGDFKFLVAKV